MVSSTEGDAHRQQVVQLIQEKDEIERKIREFGEVLQKNQVGFQDPLVDADGFPRNDIDVRSVRIARTQIICLQNDLKSVMKTIEDGMEKYFQDKKDQAGCSTASSTKLPSVHKLNIEENLRPFCVVNLVSDGSPGYNCGIQLNDLILKFGSISRENFRNLAQIGELVKNSENHQVRVKLLRNGEQLDLILVPKKWSGGPGLLGFKIAELPNN